MFWFIKTTRERRVVFIDKNHQTKRLQGGKPPRKLYEKIVAPRRLESNITEKNGNLLIKFSLESFYIIELFNF